MDFVSKKLSTYAGEVISDINESSLKRQTSGEKPNKQPGDTQSTYDTKNTNQSDTATASNSTPIVNTPYNAHARGHFVQSSLAGGIPFGGGPISNSYQPTPRLFIRTDSSKVRQNIHDPRPISQNPTDQREPQQQVPKQSQLHASDESLYEGDGWSRLWFQRVMLLTLTRLLLFVSKVYEDFQATKTYSSTGQTSYFLISAAALFLPTIVFTIYRVSRYLQLALPLLRLENQKRMSSSSLENVRVQSPMHSASGDGLARREASKDDQEDDEMQVTRALMSSPSASSGQQLVAGGGTSSPTTQLGDDDGLVTARQSPSNLDDFQDSKSHQEVGIVSSTVRMPLDQQPRLESVDIDKFGNLPDKDTTRVVIGASEQLLHGILFVFWQLKRQVDVMSFLVERACLWRKPKESEKKEMGRLSTSSDGLEWFQDFYAAFLAISVQVYTLAVQWSHGIKVGSASAIGSIPIVAPSSQGAEILQNLAGHQETIKGAFAGKDLIILSQMIVSSAIVCSLLVAVRRLDDGPLSFFLSTIGWGSLFAARIIIISMAFVHIGWYFMLPLIIGHVLGISFWIYKIALASHNDEPGEREIEAQWDDETAVELGLDRSQQDLEMESKPKDLTQQAGDTPAKPTSQWSAMEHLVLLTQILFLFAIPSIFYWPIMFNMKFHLRPLKYLLLILIQNGILIPAIWSLIPNSSPGQLYLLGAVGAFSIVGFMFVSLYYSCKPKFTEYFAMADELFNAAEKSGIYFEFCSRVFKLPDLTKRSFRRLMFQKETEEEVSIQNGKNDEIVS